MSEKPIYRGHTIQDPQVRLQEHWDEARTNPTNKFHKFLINQNLGDIDIVVTEIRKINNRQEVEDYEMILLKQDLSAGHKMLNTKKKNKADCRENTYSINYKPEAINSGEV